MPETLTRQDALLSGPRSRERVLTIIGSISAELLDIDDDMLDVDYAFLELIDARDPSKRELFQAKIAQLADDQIEDFVTGQAIAELYRIRAELTAFHSEEVTHG